MRRRAVLLPLALVVAAAAVVAAVTIGSPSETASPTGARPFSLPDLRADDSTVSLGDRGRRPAVVNFLASWCIPCRDELPLLQQAHERHGRQIAFIGVDHQDSRNAAVDLLDEVGVTFPVGYDPDGSVAGRYRLRGMPTTIFVDEEGREVGRIAGRLRADDLAEWVERLTGTRTDLRG